MRVETKRVCLIALISTNHKLGVCNFQAPLGAMQRNHVYDAASHHRPRSRLCANELFLHRDVDHLSEFPSVSSFMLSDQELKMRGDKK